MDKNAIGLAKESVLSRQGSRFGMMQKLATEKTLAEKAPTAAGDKRAMMGSGRRVKKGEARLPIGQASAWRS
jgi:hypothetical protein